MQPLALLRKKGYLLRREDDALYPDDLVAAGLALAAISVRKVLVATAA